MDEHRCFACDEKNEMRIVKTESDSWTFEFVERFVGPRGRAHGGIAIGALTCPALQIAENEGVKHPVAISVSGRLNFPVPLKSQIRVNARSEEGQYRFELSDNEMIFLYGAVEVMDREVNTGTMLQNPPRRCVDDLEDLSRMANSNIKGPTFRTQFMKRLEEAGKPWDPPAICFGCSESETALNLKTKMLEPGSLWTIWKVEPEFTDCDDRLASAIITAALDCPSLWVVATQDMELNLKSFLENKMWITGTYGVYFLRVPPVKIEGGYRVAARFLKREGNKSYSISALLDKSGTVYAFGEATAIHIDLPEGYTP